MKSELKIYNSLSGKKEIFEPIEEGRINMYVCGPTVYSDVHLGNCRTFVNFDVIYRYLLYLGYEVRYVRNITDVGHLLDDGQDRMGRAARLLKLEPMEVAQRYTNGFHDMMRIFNTLPPSIEPRAAGHIPEQIAMVQAILDRGLAYEVNGSVYFDTLKYIEEGGSYGALSGRKIEDLLAQSRDDLKKQDEKRNPADFTIWMKAAPEHIMQWESPWSKGFPGWHLECSVMSTKYLGESFDIHGGGNDLKFPHHENEIAQNMGACNHSGARYWLHTNMLLLNGKKMSKNDGNTVSPNELFTGVSDEDASAPSKHLSKGYSPMIARFFMLQSHYSSTLDLTDDALQAAEAGFRRLLEANKTLQALQPDKNAQAGELDQAINTLIDQAHAEMNDDFNTPKALARLFELAPKINGLKGGQLSIREVSADTLQRLKQTFHDFIFDIFGLKEEQEGGENGLTDGLVQLIIDIRKEARANKDWATSDQIRDTLKELGVLLKDSKEGTTWSKG